MKYLLCIDDDPIRYSRLAQRLLKENNVSTLITCRREEVLFYLQLFGNKILGICLDHDMPYHDGKYYALEILPTFQLPLIITSNNPVGTKQIAAILDDLHYRDYAEAPASDNDAWINQIYFHLNLARIKYA